MRSLVMLYPSSLDSARDDMLRDKVGVMGDLEDCTRRHGHLSKQMTRYLRLLVLTAVASVLVGAGAHARGTPPVELASNRCNSQTIDDASTKLRDYDRRGSSGNSAQLIQRYGAIVDVISVLNEERQILDGVCSSDAQRGPLFAQIASLSAWALTLESDIAVKLNASCGAAQTALPAA